MEPLYRGHIGTLLYIEVVINSEVKVCVFLKKNLRLL